MVNMTEHTEIPAWEGPAYCTGCDWESRRTGINSHDQFLYHLASLRHARDSHGIDNRAGLA